MVRNSVEETLSKLLEEEAQALTGAARYERTEARHGDRSGHNSRNLTTTSGDVELKVPKLKGMTFETAIIERCRRRESSAEEALIGMYLAGVSVRRVEDITEALWGNKVSPSRPLKGGKYPYVYVDGIYLRRKLVKVNCVHLASLKMSASWWPSPLMRMGTGKSLALPKG